MTQKRLMQPVRILPLAGKLEDDSFKVVRISPHQAQGELGTQLFDNILGEVQHSAAIVFFSLANADSLENGLTNQQLTMYNEAQISRRYLPQSSPRPYRPISRCPSLGNELNPLENKLDKLENELNRLDSGLRRKKDHVCI